MGLFGFWTKAWVDSGATSSYVHMGGELRGEYGCGGGRGPCT